MTTPPSRLVPYLLRTVRVGLIATYITLAAMMAYLVLPQSPEMNTGLYITLIALAAAGAVGIQKLSWDQLFLSDAGWWALYAWSAGDIVLVSWAVALTGGDGSPLFFLFAFTTVFFSASYPPRAQLALLVFTVACYLVASALASGGAGMATVVTRSALLGVLTFMTGFLTLERQRSEETIRELEEEQLLHAQALEINDNIVQGLVVAKYALDMGNEDKAHGAIKDTLAAASALVTDLVSSKGKGLEPGDFVRTGPVELSDRIGQEKTAT
jgi:hypothetical protein